MKPEQLLSRAAKEAKRFVKKVVNTPVGRGVIAGGLASAVGMTADNQANYQPDLNPQQAGHTLVIDNIYLQAAQKIDPSVRVDLPEIQVPTGDFETISRNGVELTRIYGPNDPDNRLFVQILLQKNATKELAKKIVGEFFLAEPMPKYLDKFTFWVRTSSTSDLGCNIVGDCNPTAVIAAIDETHNATGIYSPETIVLINNGSLNGRAFLDTYPNPPNIYSYAGVVTTLEAGGPARLLPILETAKSILLLSDLWMYPDPNQNLGTFAPNCSRTPEVWGWSPTPWRGCYLDEQAYRSDDISILRDANRTTNFGAWESTWIDKYLKLVPGNIPYPAFSLGLYRDNPVPGKGFPQGSLDLGIKPIIPYGTKNFAVELIPSSDRGTGIPNSPGLTLQFTDTGFINKIRLEGFTLPAPELGKGPYITLPGMSYTWRVRVSPDPTLPFTDGPGWQTVDATPVLKIPNTGRGEIKDFAAPRGSEKISFMLDGKTTNNLAPSLQWQGDTDVFYYHLQVSSDPTFETDPAKATAAVWENLIHGGESTPLNSWKVPNGLLQPGKIYFMRAKPRVQGDGQEAPWSTIASFKTSADATAKHIITKEQHQTNMQLAQAKDANRLMSMWNHWDHVNQKVQKRFKPAA